MARPPDLVLWNGKVFTSDPSNPFTEALAVRGERISAVGASTEIRNLAGPRTILVDLAGKTAIPGINDAHLHFDAVARDTLELDFGTRNPSWETVQRSISTAVSSAPAGAMLVGDIGSTTFRDVGATRQTLDHLSATNPVILTVLTGHAAIVNSVALSKVGFSETVEDPLGGRFERDSAGALTGVLREYAVFELMRRIADATSDADVVSRLRTRLAQAATLGITTVQCMSNAMTPQRCRALLEQVPTPIRIRIIRMPSTGPDGRNVQEGRPIEPRPSPLITQSGTKWVLDGTPLEGTFEARTTRGQRFAEASAAGAAEIEELVLGFAPTFPEEEIPRLLHETLEEGDPLMLHLSGRPAAHAVLTAMEASGGGSTWGSKRVRFEHGDGLTPDLIPRAARLGVVVVQNPGHFAGLRSSTGTPMRTFQPLRSLLSGNVPLALGSDGPMNPFLNILLATLHPNNPPEALSREEAVLAYTRTSAYAEFAEAEKGSLAPGMLADIAVLSQDIFSVRSEDLPETRSLLTFVGGTVIHSSGFDQFPVSEDQALGDPRR